MPRLPRLALLLSATLFVGHAVAGPEEDERARNALRVLTDIQEIPEQSIPDKLLDEGRAIVVIPTHSRPAWSSAAAAAMA